MPGPLEKRLIALSWQQSWFDAKHAQDIEDLAHALLREITVRHLASSPDPRASDFRDAHGDELHSELNSQSQPKTWSDEQHLIALAELIGCNAQVREHTQPQNFKTVHEEETARLAHTLDLCHIGENHWIRSTHRSKDRAYYTTNPDGNCLYRAVAQDLHRMVQEERLALSNTSTASNSTSSSHQSSRANSLSPTPHRASMNNNGPVAELQNAILAKASDFTVELRRLSQQESATLEADYRSSTPCSNGTTLSSAPKVTDISEQERRDYLLALRLQLEEIKLYRKGCAAQ